VRAIEKAVTYMTAERIFPIIVMRRMRFRPYLSESAPILGDTKNWSVLKGCYVPSILRWADNARKDGAHETTQKYDIPAMRLNARLVK